MINLEKNGAATRIRTADLMITNQLLYQLSYAGFVLKRLNYAKSRAQFDKQFFWTATLIAVRKKAIGIPNLL